jgi:predicted lipoprotein with Yx(FWY)xxD motif
MKSLAILLLFNALGVAAQAETVPLTRTVVVEGRSLLASSFSQTLYVFDPDLKAGKSVCTGVCAEKWPPYTVTADEASKVSPPFSTQIRDNGLLQVTYEQRPIYLFHLDRAVGEIKGEGLGGVWHTIEATEK